jgi:peptide/nickel transport system substrate-binding protein
MIMAGSMTRRGFLHSVALGSGGALLASRSTWAAAPAAKPGGTLICGWEAEPGAFDNDIDRGAVTRTLLHNIYDRLVDRNMTVKANQPLVGNLATSWVVSPDARTYTFKLRPGVKFHDGTPVDAEAVKFNIDRDSDPSHKYYNKLGAGSLKLGYGGLARVEVVDKSTIRIVHKEPFADFLEVLAFGTYSIASPTAIQKYGNDEYPNHPVGSGPFKYVGREKGVKVTFERNPDYWAGPPALDGFIVRPLPEAVTRVTALQTGEVDWINAVNPDSIDSVKSNANLVLEFAQLPNTWGYIPNHKYPPTTKLQLRQAMSWAIDRETLARDVMKGLAVPAKGTHAQGTPGYDANIKGYGYDPAKAKQLLADAGFPKGLPLEVWMPAGGAGSPFGIQMNEFIQQNFKAVGIDAAFAQQEFQTFQNNMANGIQPNVNAIQVGFSVDEFVNLQRMFRTDLQPPNGNTNPGWYGNAAVDGLLKKALTTTNAAQRRQLYFQVEQKAVDDAAWIFVVHQRAARAWNKRVRGFVNPNSYMFTFRTVSLG